MAIQSYDVAPADDILSVDHNYLRADLLTNAIDMDGVKTFNDDIYLLALKKIYFDGGGNTYIVEAAADQMSFYTGGLRGLSINSNQDVIINATKKLYFDGGSNTYVAETAADQFSLYIAGIEQARFCDTETFFRPGHAGAVHPNCDGENDLGKDATHDWETVYYHNLSQHSSEKAKINIEEYAKSNLNINKLPSVKTYEYKTKLGVIEFGLISEDCPLECQHTDKEGNLNISLNKLVAYLCGVIKILGERIDKLEKPV